MPPYTATAWSKRDPQGGGDGELISQVKQEFDGRGNLLKDWQSFGTEIVSGTPKTEYEWDVDYTASPEDAGHTRLSGMDYPRFTTGAYLRTVDFGYGSAQRLPDALGLICSIDSDKNGVHTDAADFAWVGSGRRSWMTFGKVGTGGGGKQDFLLDEVYEQVNGQIGVLGLDPWGRVGTLYYRPGLSVSPLCMFSYTYDLAGRRAAATRQPDPFSTPPTISTIEKHTNTYDDLDRLTHFKTTNSTGLITRLEQDWTLDLLGNWDQRTTTTPSPTTIISHTTDERNRIESVETKIGNNSPTSKTCLYDAAGNLEFDGTYAYQYDAWNRLVSVHTAHLNGGNGIVLDLLVKHHSYDAIGRLARTLSPYPSPAQQSGGALRSERFYYDGIRRLVEVQIDTVKSLAGALASGNQTYANLANDALDLSDGDIDQSAAPAAYEVAYIAAASPTITTTREYIWGPGDRGIYELIMQFDASNARLWVMQDEGGDVAAACDAGGVNNQLRLVGLWSYGPYGEVIKDVSLIAHSPIHAGHKGLFVDRLDAGVAGIGGAETTRLATGATHAVFANNRHLLPKLGRWCQADPNASGLVTLAEAHSARSIRPFTNGIELEDLYGNGASLYQYVGSAPWSRADPTGLWFGFAVGLVMPGPSDITRSVLQSIVTEYAANQDWDLEWAGDWTTGDDWYSRLDNTWIALAAIRGVYEAFWVGIPFTDIGFNPLDLMYGSLSPVPTKPPRTPKSRFPALSTVAHFTRIVDVGGFRATLYKAPNLPYSLARFDSNAIRARVTVPETYRTAEVTAANRAAGYTSTPQGWMWHHHWEHGVMYLVPEELHKALNAAGMPRHGGRTYW